VGNRAQNGAVFAVEIDPGNNMTFSQCQFLDNEAQGYGGIFLSESFSSVNFSYPFLKEREREREIRETEGGGSGEEVEEGESQT